MTDAIDRSHRRVNWRHLSLAIVVGVVAMMALANVHLVYVAVSSQPDCVAHVTDKGKDGSFRAAKPAC